MAINKKLIHFKNKEYFDREIANNNILDTSICFIQDSKEISTHGTVYKTVNWDVLSLITFTVKSTKYQAEEGMTWEEFVNSNYNDGSFSVEGTTYRVKYNNNEVLAFSGSLVNCKDLIKDGITYLASDPSSGGAD